MRHPSRQILGLMLAPLALGVWAWWHSQNPAPPGVKLFSGQVLALDVSPGGWIRAIGKETDTSYSQGSYSQQMFAQHSNRSLFGLSFGATQTNITGSKYTTKREASYAQFSNGGKTLFVWEHDNNGQNPVRAYDLSNVSGQSVFKGIASTGLTDISPNAKWHSSVLSDPYDYGSNWILRPVTKPEYSVSSPLKDQVRSSAFSDDGRYVFIALSTGTVQQWHLNPPRKWRSRGQAVPMRDDVYVENSIVPSPDGARCLWQHGSSFEMLDWYSGQTFSLRGSLSAAKWTPDCTRFVLFASQGATIFNAKDGSFVRDLPVGGNITASTFSPDSRYLFVGNNEGYVMRCEIDK